MNNIPLSHLENVKIIQEARLELAINIPKTITLVFLNLDQLYLTDDVLTITAQR